MTAKDIHSLTALSPLDGRYQHKTTELSHYFSEMGLSQYRMMIEIKWFTFLSEQKDFSSLPALSDEESAALENLIKNFDIDSAKQIKAHEAICNHDVKSIEYYLRENLENIIGDRIELIHFACTSEDINNLAYSLMVKDSLEKIILPKLNALLTKLIQFSHEHAAEPMLCHTHGQAATPSTLGKEFANVAYRLKKILNRLDPKDLTGKFNGATGNYNAHLIAYPEINWLDRSQAFVESLGLNFEKMSTQIEAHDNLVILFDTLQHINHILLDLSQDCWQYISMDYLKLARVNEEVGSSTMPHKVNPIQFENAEGNLGLANSLLHHFSTKLTRSRLQRDLSDSTVLRNIGSAFAYSLIAYAALEKGLGQITANTAVMQADLNRHWEILAEPIQTVMRKYRIPNAYEQLKSLSRGKILERDALKRFIESLPIPAEDKDRLLALRPDNYLGLAEALTKNTRATTS